MNKSLKHFYLLTNEHVIRDEANRYSEKSFSFYNR